jgi:site-specific DNA-cytosine methylase
MAQPRAACVVHGKDCDVKHPEAHGTMFLSAGFSCKTASPLSNKRSIEAKDAIKAKKGTTGGTFAALHEHNLEYASPLQILENVPELLAAGTSNLQAITNMYKQAGYVIKAVVTDAEKLGAAMVRRRAYFIAVHLEQCGLSESEAETLLKTALSTLSSLEMKPIRTMRDFILPDDHALVLRELEQMQAISAKELRHCLSQQQFYVSIRGEFLPYVGLHVGPGSFRSHGPTCKPKYSTNAARLQT